MKNKKTTIAGILTIAIAIGKVVLEIMNKQPVDFSTLLVGLAAGATGLVAKDNNVTGGSVSQPTVPNIPVLIEDKK